MSISHRDIAKVGVGLFAADLVSVIWLGTAGFFPLTVLGVTWGMDSIVPIAVFDIAVIVLLVHWGWHTKVPVRSPSEHRLLQIAGLIFLIIALMHLLRLAFGWQLILGSFEVPLWLSWFGVIVAGYLSYGSFHFAGRR